MEFFKLIQLKSFDVVFILNVFLYAFRFKAYVEQVRQMCNGRGMSNVFVGGGQSQVFINGVR